MTYTPEALTAEMQHLDYPVTKRRLIDWVQKGLLPHPTPRGRGRGPGKMYEWHEPDILHRAIDVFELLKWHRRAADLFLPLWILGYDVPLHEVRAGLQRLVDGLDTGIEAAVPRFGDRSDLVSDLLVTAEAQLQGQPDAPPLPLIAAFLHAFIDPATRDWSLLLEDLGNALTSAEREHAAWPELGGAMATAASIRDQLSVPHLRETVANAPEGNLALVHRDLRTVMQSARAVASVGMDIEPGMLIRILVTVGSWGAVVDLALRRGGHDEMVDRSVSGFTDACHRLLTDPWLRADMQRLRAGQGAPDTANEVRMTSQT
jgi:hypothetical protein